jgi:MFS family permease
MHTFRPYLNLVRYNRNYRRLWLSQAISNFGDWFGMLAIYELIREYSASELLIGLIIVVKLMSFAVFSPFAGYLTDRFDRRSLMIWCDVGRAFVVLGLLLVQPGGMIWLVYVLLALQMMMAAIFEPAKSSSIPNITSNEELVIANVISTLTWSVIFTVGMAVGGFATAAFGVTVVFILNSATYLLSGWFVYKAAIPHLRTSEQIAAMSSPAEGIKKGIQFLLRQHHILRPALAKGWIEVSLGALVYLLIIVSEDILAMGSIGLGLLYAARGVGTAIGPMVIRSFFQDESRWITALGVCMGLVGLGYLLVGFTTSLYAMMALVMFAHAGSGANWVTSTVLIQKRTPDEYRGRVFSSEWLLLTVVESISVMIAAGLLYFNIMDLPQTIRLFAIILIIISVIWHFTVARSERKWQHNLVQGERYLVPDEPVSRV